ncbi:uncharacterized protein LOC108328707 [Vigna angularis]|uniref:uncharacterized protein LOC108328707 n=1 Tax=Phaseolus angularis TaxID=3914 RepID=UPI0022B4A721|nr:uncharacterized protein LOC108328707 [Vigna angularis]
MDDLSTRELIQQLQTQIEVQAQTIREQHEIQRKQTEELAALRAQQPPPELSASNRHDNNEGSHHGGPSDPLAGGKRGPSSARITNLLPFTDTIMQAHMPDKPPPVLDRYDGSADPDNHMRNFIDSMAFYTDNDPVICRAFSLSLKDDALEWFHTLPRNSIDCFATIETLFRKQYATNKKPEMTAAELVNTKQEKDETLRAFMQRYNETARRVKNINHTFIISNLPSCLKPGHFAEQLYADPPTSLEELQSTIAKFIRIEDLRNSRKKQQQDTSNHDIKKPLKRSINDYKPDRAPRKELAKVLEEALHAELLTVRRKATPKNADNSKACLFHVNHGHDTEECNIVKDELERLIRAGYLQNYVKDRISTRATASPRKDPFRQGPERSPPRVERRHRRSRSPPRRVERERSVRGRIDTISGGFAGGGASSSARKRSLRNLKSVHMVDQQPRSIPDITFTNADFHAPDPDHDDPMVITANIARYDVSKVLIDQGSSVNILFWSTFKKMDLSEDLIAPFNEQIVGFSGERVDTRGYLDLRTRLGISREAPELRIRFLLVEANTSYNALIGRPCLNAFGAIVSTPHLAMKFPTERGTICTVKADQRTARQCYVAGLKLSPLVPMRKSRRTDIAAIELDPRTNTEDRLHPQGDVKLLPLTKDPNKTTTIGGNLDLSDEHNLGRILRANADLFAWTAADMPGIHPGVMSHKLSIFREARPVAQKKRRFGEEKRKAIQVEVEKLMNARFIKELTYTMWLSNVVMVKKSSGQWRMCVDFTDLNKACPKDSYPLPSIDRLVDGASGHTILSFLDAYSGYNQIPMYAPDQSKTAFITEQANYCYEVMPFGLKNAGATYQRLMDKVFHQQIGRCMDVYVDDMVIRSNSMEQHLRDIKEVFGQISRYSMRLNPSKCTFGVPAGKFLGFMLTSRGIEANPDKCKAVLDMISPKTLREVQRLVGRLTALSRFIPKLAEHIKPILRSIKKDTTQHWNDDCEAAFDKVKHILTRPPIMARPDAGSNLLLYIAASHHAVSAALIQEVPSFKLIYFISRTLQGAEERYSQIEKIALALLTASRRLRPYFQSHQVIVRTDHPIAKILRKPDLTGRIVSWSIELSEFGLRYEPRGSVKGQHLADFATELVPPPGNSTLKWLLNVDGSSDKRGGGAGVLLEGPDGLIIEQAIMFKFHASNNQAEYEALIAGLSLAVELQITCLECRMDSQLVVGQMNGTYQVKDNQLLRYFHKTQTLLQNFIEFSIVHIPREQNARADILSKLTHSKERAQLSSIIKMTLDHPVVEALAIDMSTPRVDWRLKVKDLMMKQEQGEDISVTDSKRIARYVCIGDDLYRRGHSTPLLKCISEEDADYVLRELHTGIRGFHSGKRTLRARILRAGYYWPTIDHDCDEFVKKCVSCQAHGHEIHAPPEELHYIVAPWPFAQWGLDIVGPLPPAKAQNKFLLVAVDYFTKWIEAEPLSVISAQRVQKFIWHLVCRFGLPQKIITDNGRQFIERKLEEFLNSLGIKHITSSVEHPQTNGQAEAANKAILTELKKRLGEAKSLWVEELPEVLWAYRCTPHGSTGDTPFNLTYGTDAMLPVEVGEPSLRRNITDMSLNEEQLRMNLDVLPERREIATIRAEAQKRMLSRRYNSKVKPRSFKSGDLVWRKRGEARKDRTHGKLAANWEGPFRVAEEMSNGAYRLQLLDGQPIPNTWNATHLKYYFS